MKSLQTCVVLVLSTCVLSDCAKGQSPVIDEAAVCAALLIFFLSSGSIDVNHLFYYKICQIP